MNRTNDNPRVSVVESSVGNTIFIYQHPLALDEYGNHKVIIKSLDTKDKDVACIQSELENLLAPKSRILWGNRYEASKIYDEAVIDLFYNIDTSNLKIDDEDGKLFNEYQKLTVNHIRKIDDQTNECKLKAATMYKASTAIDTDYISALRRDIGEVNKLTSHMLDILNKIGDDGK